MLEIHEIKLGDVTITRIEEMHGPIMSTEDFFPDMPEQSWQEHRDWLVPDHLGATDTMVHVAIQTWLLRSNGRTILVDTGVGNDKSRPSVDVWNHLELDYLGNLARAGVRPEDVDLVINTHLHVDHVGWNTRLINGEWAPTFPNATYLMPRADFEFWNPANNSRITGSTNENVYEDSVVPVHNAGQVQLWEDSHTIDENLWLAAAPAHTPGSSVLRLESGADRALFVGDLMHTPLQLTYPDRNSCFCEDPAEARATRRKLLGWAAESNALVLPAHFSGHGAMSVQERGSGFAIKQWAPFTRY